MFSLNLLYRSKDTVTDMRIVSGLSIELSLDFLGEAER